jgi:hypothetical protein
MGGGAWSGIRVWCGKKKRSGLLRVALRCVSFTGFIREPTSPFFPSHVRAGFFWIGAAGDETKSIRAQAQAQLQATQTKSIRSTCSIRSYVSFFPAAVRKNCFARRTKL